MADTDHCVDTVITDCTPVPKNLSLPWSELLIYVFYKLLWILMSVMDLEVLLRTLLFDCCVVVFQFS